MLFDIKSGLHDLQHLLRQRFSLAVCSAIFYQHGKFVAAQPGYGKTLAKNPLQTIADPFEQKVADVVPKAVINNFEMIKVDD